MNLPIFITGFERSGTTLLRRLVSMNPLLEFDLIHEKKKLLKYKTKEEAIQNYKMKTKQAGQYLGSWSSIEAGEKLPYVDSKYIIKYTKKWKSFWPNSVIFHIIRNIGQCSVSAKRTFNKDIEQTKKSYKINVPKVREFLGQYNNVYEITFEELIDKPEETLKKIYGIMGSVPSDDYINKVLNTRNPWEYNGRKMCGLRYFDRIERR